MSRPSPEALGLVQRQLPVAGRVWGFEGAAPAPAGADYRSFEDVFRGSEALIRDRQRVYPQLIGAREPVLDLGCGRGELLDLLRDAGVSCAGVDQDESMVARCREKGHEVTLGDGLAHLGRLPDASVGAITALQVLEHLSADERQGLLATAIRKLMPGGVLILETVNPHAPQALKHFWLDATHHHPVFPEVALVQARLAGFGSAYVFHPGGSGDSDRDRLVMGDYALVAER